MPTDRFTDDKARVRDELEQRAKARATITYGEVSVLVGLANQGLAPILNAIRDEEAKCAKPDLGCLVVRADTGFPCNVGAREHDREIALAVRRAVFSAWRAVP